MFPMKDLVPHSGEMLLVDKCLDFGDSWLIAQVTIREGCLFCENGKVPALVGIEFMAQTIAAFAGKNDKIANKKPSIGLLLGTRKFESTVDHFVVGAVLKIHVEQLYKDDSRLGVFKCKITADNILVEANLSVYHPDDISLLIKKQK